MQKKLSIRDIDIEGKRILIRAELNVPLDGSSITSNQRIKATLPTIQYCIEKRVRSIVILSHIGKPGKQVSLAPVAIELEKLLKRKIVFLKSCVGSEVAATCMRPTKGAIILLENVRFHIEEEGKIMDENGNENIARAEQIEAFRNWLSKLGDIFVNDAFGVIQRSHSSMAGINLEVRVTGLLMEKELECLSELMNNPKRPFLFIIGGAKVTDKIKLIENLLSKVDEMIIGGAMAFTFLKVLKNMKIGRSILDGDASKSVHNIIAAANSHKVKMHFPVDFLAAKSIEDSCCYSKLVSFFVDDGIPDDLMGLDCGPRSISQFACVVERANTIFWNGPMGVFEKPAFADGTRGLLDAVAKATRRGARTVIGGGDTGSACAKFGKMDEINHVSTGGGASIAYLEGKELPGLAHLSNWPSENISQSDKTYIMKSMG